MNTITVLNPEPSLLRIMSNIQFGDCAKFIVTGDVPDYVTVSLVGKTHSSEGETIRTDTPEGAARLRLARAIQETEKMSPAKHGSRAGAEAYAKRQSAEESARLACRQS